MRASLCLRLHTTRPTQSCTEGRSRRPGQGTHRGELWTLGLRARERAWVTQGCSLRAAPRCCLRPRPLCSSRDCPQGPLGWRAAAREPPAWKRRTCGPERLSRDLLTEYVPSRPAWRALIAGVPALLLLWASGEDVRRRLCHCWWPWPRCWWAQPATCTLERVSLGQGAITVCRGHFSHRPSQSRTLTLRSEGRGHPSPPPQPT